LASVAGRHTSNNSRLIISGLRKMQVSFKESPTTEFFWVLGFIWFSDFLNERALGKLVG